VAAKADAHRKEFLELVDAAARLADARKPAGRQRQ
jgi:hypothetical protein